MHLGPAAGQGAPTSCGSTRARRGTATSTRSSPNGDHEVTFQLKRPQPAFLALLASGFTPVYPCHVSPAEMRQHPIGTGPFKFVEFKPNEYIKVTRNPDYWKKDRPYLDGIEYQIIKNVATGALAFVSGKVDMTSWYFLQVPMLNDINKQMGQELCHMSPTNVLRSVIINREAAPFNKPEVRRAMALTLDRKAFIDTLTQGKGIVGGALAVAAVRRLGHAVRHDAERCRATVPMSRPTAPKPAS